MKSFKLKIVTPDGLEFDSDVESLLVRTDDGAIYLVCNPVAANWGMRSPLTLFKSTDEGATWQKLLDLETEPGEFSYPAIIAHDGVIYITYTHNRQNIACVRIPIVNI